MVRFVARQPIFTANQDTVGYELLFRDGPTNQYASTDPNLASCSILDTSIVMGLDVLCGHQLAFVNCTREILLLDFITVLPSHQTVIEILETVPPDDQVKAACRRLKQAGYLIALDDFCLNDPRKSLSSLADIIKVDLRVTPLKDAAKMIKQHRPRGCRMLAEKVETKQEFQEAKEAGFDYFQGYFFCKPQLMHRRDIPASTVNLLRMLRAATREELDASEIESVIKSDASLCYRLLRYLNSAMFGFSSEVHSVRHALALLGQELVRRWICLVTALAAGRKESDALVLMALVRARFCELLSPKVEHGDSDLFLLGLISAMDSLLDTTMVQVLEHVPVDRDIKKTLLGRSSPLQPLYQLMLANESGEWIRLKALMKKLRLDENDVAQAYWNAMEWANEVTSDHSVFCPTRNRLTRE